MSSEIADLNFNISRILYSKWICETSSAWSRKKTHKKNDDTLVEMVALGLQASLQTL